jgi:hypothetical protein
VDGRDAVQILPPARGLLSTATPALGVASALNFRLPHGLGTSSIGAVSHGSVSLLCSPQRAASGGLLCLCVWCGRGTLVVRRRFMCPQDKCTRRFANEEKLNTHRSRAHCYLANNVCKNIDTEAAQALTGLAAGLTGRPTARSSPIDSAAIRDTKPPKTAGEKRCVPSSCADQISDCTILCSLFCCIWLLRGRRKARLCTKARQAHVPHS